jgi:amino acid permease
MHKVADQVIEKGVDAVQQKLGIELKPEGEATPEYNAKLQEEANRHAEFMAELDEKSTQRATDMYMQDDSTKKFTQMYAWFITIVSFAYFFIVSFAPIENRNRDFINIILGFLIGTAVNSLIRFFYGSSNKSQEDVDKKQKEMAGDK